MTDRPIHRRAAAATLRRLALRQLFATGAAVVALLLVGGCVDARDVEDSHALARLHGPALSATGAGAGIAPEALGWVE